MTIIQRHRHSERVAPVPAARSTPALGAVGRTPQGTDEPIPGGPGNPLRPLSPPGTGLPVQPAPARCQVELGALTLERGARLPEVQIAFETWGQLDERGENVVLVEHALTGDSHVVGAAGGPYPSPGWWDAMIGPGAPIDTDNWFVVSTNVLGGCQGSTGPSSEGPDDRPWGGRFPAITIRDQVLAEAAVLDRLGVRRLAAVVGGSMGGMRALEWAATYPDRVDRALVFASTAAATADQIAWCQAQLLAIRSDPNFAGGDYYGTGRLPSTGLGLARRIAHITYRTEAELGERFGRRPQTGEDPHENNERGRFAVESYLDHHAGKLAGRFDANSYLVLTEAMNSHDVGRGRGGVARALAGVSAECTVVSVDTDRLYPPRLSDELHAALPRSTRASITSHYGHDGFLIETGQVAQIVRSALSR